MKHTDKVKISQTKHHFKPQERVELLSDGLDINDSEGRKKASFRELIRQMENKGEYERI